MITYTLVQQVDQLVEYMESIQILPTAPEQNLSEEWATLFRISNEIANQPTYGSETMTQSVTTMRR